MLPTELVKDLDLDSAAAQTMSSFGYQWNAFPEVYDEWRDDFFDFVSPLQQSYFRSKLGIDVGCGMGRYTRVVGEEGAEIVGIDLSDAVEAAFSNTRHLPNVHIVQGDINKPPVKTAFFDFAHSIGVLHHLPDPRSGFVSLRGLVRPGGGVIVWVYSDTKHPIYGMARLVTRRLPFQILRCLCFFLAVAIWFFFIVPIKAARAIGLQSVADRIKFQRYARFPFRALHTDLFDELSAPVIHGHSEAEVREWFVSSGLDNVMTSATGKHGWRGYGEA